MISFITIWIVWVLYISFWVPRVVSALEFHDIKGSFCQKNSIAQTSYFSYGVSYSSFWSEKPKNHLNFGLKVCPLEPPGGRTLDLEWRRYRTSRGGAQTSRSGTP